MRTSARRRDGAVLHIGGLADPSRRDQPADTPGLSKFPPIGWLFLDKSYEDKNRELVITVNPTIVREPPIEGNLWAFPSTSELMPSAARKPAADKAAADGTAPAKAAPKSGGQK
jgi:type II secretory pathway component GspD/PulD (secretin)